MALDSPFYRPDEHNSTLYKSFMPIEKMKKLPDDLCRFVDRVKYGIPLEEVKQANSDVKKALGERTIVPGFGSSKLTKKLTNEIQNIQNNKSLDDSEKEKKIKKACINQIRTHIGFMRFTSSESDTILKIIATYSMERIFVFTHLGCIFEKWGNWKIQKIEYLSFLIKGRVWN